MKKPILFTVAGILLGAAPLFAQMTPEQGGSGAFGQPGGPNSTLPGSNSQNPNLGGPVPCPPGTAAPDLNQGNQGGSQNPGLGGGSPGSSNTLPPPGAVPPNPQGSVPPNPQGIPSNPQGSVPNTPGGTLGGDQGGVTHPGDQLGMTDCPPSGTDRGGLGSTPGQDLPGSNRATPPPLLPPAGGVQ